MQKYDPAAAQAVAAQAWAAQAVAAQALGGHDARTCCSLLDYGPLQCDCFVDQTM